MASNLVNNYTKVRCVVPFRLFHEYYVAFGNVLTEVPNPSSRASARFASNSLKNSNNKNCLEMDVHSSILNKMT